LWCAPGKLAPRSLAYHKKAGKEHGNAIIDPVNWDHVDSLVDRRIDLGKNHIWPFGSSVPIDVRFLVMDRRSEIPLHRPDHLEVVVFESGELGYEVENKTCVLGKNDVIIAI
jgi:hypothetical protein